jgi:ribonuclease HII
MGIQLIGCLIATAALFPGAAIAGAPKLPPGGTVSRVARVVDGDVLAHAEAVSLVSIPASQIDRIGIDPANVACLERALRPLGERAELRLVDGDGRLELGAGAPVHEWIIHGDATSATIAAASIVAKVTRDRLLVRLGERYPGYGFERHKGYGTEEHRAAVVKLGPTSEHRLSVNARCFADFAARVEEAAKRTSQSPA